MHLQGPVRVIQDLRPAGGANASEDLLPVLLVTRVNRELANPLSLGAGTGNEVDALQLSPRLGNRRGQLSERLLARVELDADRDAVLGADGHRAQDSTERREPPRRARAGSAFCAFGLVVAKKLVDEHAGGGAGRRRAR